MICLGAATAFADRTVSANYTLASDEDWSNDGIVTLAENITIDLAGHTLILTHLSASSGSGFTGTTGSAVVFAVDESASHTTLGEAEFIDNIANLTLSGSAKILLVKNGSGGTLSATKMYLGDSHYAEFCQTNGAVSLTGETSIIGRNSGSHGVYRMSGGTLDASKAFSVASAGVGEFIQTGGVARFTNWLNIGRNGGTGTYTVTGGVVTNMYNNNNNSPVYVGDEGGTGTLNVGGAATVKFYQLSMGGHNQASGKTNKGYLNVSGNGVFETASWGTIGAKDYGYGEVNQTGGKVTFGSEFSVGEYGTGIYNLTDGELTVGGMGLIVGRRPATTADGTFIQGAGRVTCASLHVGSFYNNAPSTAGKNATGAYTQNGGMVVSSGNECIGWHGTGTYIQNGGTNRLSSSSSYLSLGEKPDSKSTGVGRYVLNDGRLEVAGYIKVGKAGTATLEINGGEIAASKIYSEGGTSSVLANGGAVKVSANNARIFCNVKSVAFGGAFAIDTAGHSAFMTNNTSVTATEGASFTKKGAGTLTVDALPSSCPVTVESGSLSLKATRQTTLESLTFNSGASFDISSYSGVTPLAVTTLTFPSEGTVALTLNGGTFPEGVYAIYEKNGVTSADGAGFAPSTGELRYAWSVEGTTLILTVGDFNPNAWSGRGGDGRMSNGANWVGGLVPGVGADIDFSGVTTATTIIADAERTFGAVTTGSAVITFTGSLSATDFTDRTKIAVGADSTVTHVGDLEISGSSAQYIVYTVGAGGRFVVDGRIIATPQFTANRLWQCVTASCPGTVAAKGLVNTSGSTDIGSFRISSNGEASSGRNWAIGEYGISGADNNIFWITDDQDCSVTIKADADFSLESVICVRRPLLFDTTGADGLSHTITIGDGNGHGGLCGVDAGPVTISGTGKVVANFNVGTLIVPSNFNTANYKSSPYTVNNAATLMLKSGANIGTGKITVNSGAMLEVAESGTVALGGNLTLKAGAKLGFNYTNHNEPLLDMMGKTVTFDKGATTNVVVKISAAEGARAKAGENVLTSGGKFADATVSLAADAPNWVEDISIVNGDIVLIAKPAGTIFIIR